MAILVTGGAGYIGSIVADDLLARGNEVVVLDNLMRGHRAAVPAEAAFYRGDVGDRTIVKRICDEHEITAAVHFAAVAYVGESVERPELYYRLNTAQSVELIDQLRACGVRHFVFSSTCATYGEPQHVPIDELHPQRPTNPYGWSKLFIEQALRDFDRAHGVRFVALRYFNACGAAPEKGELHDPETHLIPLILDAAIGKRPTITVFGDDYPTADGTCVRDYVHVSDLSDAHILALDHLAAGGGSEFFNLGNGNGFSVNEVIDAARRVTGMPIEVTIAPRRTGDPSTLVANAARARNELGWDPKFTDIESIIETAWQWHRSEGFEKLAATARS